MQFIKKEKRIDYNVYGIPIIINLLLVPFFVYEIKYDLSLEARHIFGGEFRLDYFTKGKSLVIFTVGMLMLAMLLIKLSRKEWHLRDIPMVYLIGIGSFLIGSILSTLLSVYPLESIWGAMGRSEGMIVTFAYVAMFGYAVMLGRYEKAYVWIWGALALTTIIMSIIGTMQELRLWEFSEYLADPAVYGTLGNRNYSGSFAALVIPFFTALSIVSRQKEQRVIFIIASLSGLLILAGGKSSAGIVGVVLSVVVLILLRWQVIKQYKKSIVKVMIVACIGFLIVDSTLDQALVKEMRHIINNIKTLVMPAKEDTQQQITPQVLEVKVEGEKVSVLGNQDTMTITYDGQVFRFINSQGKHVPISTYNDKYHVRSGRWPQMIFEHAGSAKGNILKLKINGRAQFYLNFTNPKEPIVQDPYIRQEMINQEAPSIGFKGKERIGSGRGYIWSRSIPMMKETWLIGHGPDTYAITFPQNDYWGKWQGLGTLHIVVDKPHNLYLQLGINNGGVALLGFLVVVGVYIIESVKLYRLSKGECLQEQMGIAIMLAIVGYLGASFFNDSVVSVAPIFWILLGCGIGINTKLKKEKNRQNA